MELVIGASGVLIERLFTQIIKPLLDSILIRFYPGGSERRQETRTTLVRALTLLIGVLIAFGVNFFPIVFTGEFERLLALDAGFRVLVLGSIIAAASNGIHWTVDHGIQKFTNLLDAWTGLQEARTAAILEQSQARASQKLG